MRAIYYICAQPANYYYSWQVDAMLLSFEENGQVDLSRVHIVSALQNGQPAHEWFLKVASKWAKKGVTFAYYEDTRPQTGYISSIRPHILEKHWQVNPWLADETIMYHDCDIALTQPIPLHDKLAPGLETTCFLSDTKSYIGAKYIESKGHGLLEDMCAIVGISPGLVRLKESESGGAQYLLKPGIDAQFWQEVYTYSEQLFTQISERVRQIKQAEPEWHELQIWCADMWAVLWSLWKRGYTTPCHEDLDFVWGTQGAQRWDQLPIFHNAGVVKEVAGEPFYKAKYQHKSPITAPIPNEKWASHKYFDLVTRAHANTVDFTSVKVSVLVMTWKRTEMLEECIESYLRQDRFKDTELVVVNDDPAIEYQFDHPNVRIFNTPLFETFMQKMKFGISQCTGEYVYRLDDDDLLAERGLDLLIKDIDGNPGFDIYTGGAHWYVSYNENVLNNGYGGSANNGNCWLKSSILTLDWENAPEPPGEDQWMLYNKGFKAYHGKRPNLIYRFEGVGYHLTHKPAGNNLTEWQTAKWGATDKKQHQLKPGYSKNWDWLTVQKPNQGPNAGVTRIKEAIPHVFLCWTGSTPMSAQRARRLEEFKSKVGLPTTLITPENLAQWTIWEPLHEAYQYLHETHKADYLRTYLLHFWGGGYSDIKATTANWQPALEALNAQPEMWITGYPEIRGGAAWGPAEDYTKLIGNGAYIAKPRTLFTTQWYTRQQQLLTQRLPQLKASYQKWGLPGPQGNDAPDYPINWNEMLGHIFHEVNHKFSARCLQGLPISQFSDYR